MPARNHDLHGHVPDHCRVALLLVDVINELDFPEGEGMLPAALEMAEKLALLAQRARAAGVPVIYVNDNFGRWQSDFAGQVKHCLREEVRGKPVVERLLPQETDYSVLKPKHSAFFSTSLDLLLHYLGAEDLIITGMAGNLCVLYTANDAYMRDFRLHVPADCTASNTKEENEYALEQMRKQLKANVGLSETLDLEKLKRGGKEEN